MLRRLILTRTDRASAVAQAQQTESQRQGTFARMIGEKAANVSDVSALITTYQPHLVCISARDPIIGDRIHAQYAQLALPKSAVLWLSVIMIGQVDLMTILKLMAGQQVKTIL